MRLMGLVFAKTALDNLEAIPRKSRRLLIKKAKALVDDPHPRGSKKLIGYVTDDGESVYRQRSGDYRILYVVRDNPGEIVILDIDHRKDIYKGR